MYRTKAIICKSSYVTHCLVVWAVTFLGFLSAAAVEAKVDVAAKKAKPDPSIVLVREVAPRIGYRALPKEQLPVSARATVFPASVFEQSMGSVISATASETDLMQRGSLGILVPGADGKSPLAVTSRLQNVLGGEHSRVGVGAAARRSSGTVGVAGRITSATGQISSIIPAAINQAVKPSGKPGG
jgi:hypothetical protein